MRESGCFGLGMAVAYPEQPYVRSHALVRAQGQVVTWNYPSNFFFSGCQSDAKPLSAGRSSSLCHRKLVLYEIGSSWPIFGLDPGLGVPRGFLSSARHSELENWRRFDCNSSLTDLLALASQPMTKFQSREMRRVAAHRKPRRPSWRAQGDKA